VTWKGDTRNLDNNEEIRFKKGDWNDEIVTGHEKKNREKEMDGWDLQPSCLVNSIFVQICSIGLEIYLDY
jgi:hypothetical protein